MKYQKTGEALKKMEPQDVKKSQMQIENAFARLKKLKIKNATVRNTEIWNLESRLS
jgi:hypothetical protein